MSHLKNKSNARYPKRYFDNPAHISKKKGFLHNNSVYFYIPRTRKGKLILYYFTSLSQKYMSIKELRFYSGQFIMKLDPVIRRNSGPHFARYKLILPNTLCIHQSTFTTTTGILVPHVNEWSKQKLQGKWMTIGDWTTDFVIWFEREEDRMHFKMRWSV